MKLHIKAHSVAEAETAVTTHAPESTVVGITTMHPRFAEAIVTVRDMTVRRANEWFHQSPLNEFPLPEGSLMFWNYDAHDEKMRTYESRN